MKVRSKKKRQRRGAGIDTRMYWVRNLDLLAGSAGYLHEFEVASEKSITGLCNYEAGAIRIYQLAPRGLDGLAKYMVEARVARSLFNPDRASAAATEEGYVARKGVIGELLGILSLYFRARFFLLSSSLRVSESAMQHRSYNDFRYHPCPHNIDRIVFLEQERTFAENGLQELLDMLRRLPPKYHQAFAFAFEHYGLALQEIGVNEEMVFVRLVSAVEALSSNINVPERDVLYGKSFEELIRKEKLGTKEYHSLKQTFSVRKTKARFQKFLELYSSDFPFCDEQNVKAVLISRSKLNDVTEAIYSARSGYLHNGDLMYLSLRVGEHWQNWDIDPSRGQILGGKRWPEEKKLPYAHWFHRLVRHCALRYLGELVATAGA